MVEAPEPKQQKVKTEILQVVENVSEVFKAPRLAPETYPGQFPETTCTLLKEENLYGLRWNTEVPLGTTSGDFAPVIDTPDGPISLDDYLTERQLPTLAERYALTVFASNRCPGQLLDKFRKSVEKGDPARPDLEVVPMFRGILKGYDVVYNAKVGNLGYFFADLYQGPETTDTEIEVSVLFLTRQQLQILHDSEKQYDFKLLGKTRVGSLDIPAFVHVGKVSAYADPSEASPRPIAVKGVRAERRGLRDLDQVQFQELVFDYDPSGAKRKAFAEITGDPNPEASSSSYLLNMKMERAGGVRKLAERKHLQELLNNAIGDEERLDIDPNQFKATEFIDLENQPIPRLGEIAVLNFLEAAASRSKP